MTLRASGVELTAISLQADMEIPVPSICFSAYSFSSFLWRQKQKTVIGLHTSVHQQLVMLCLWASQLSFLEQEVSGRHRASWEIYRSSITLGAAQLKVGGAESIWGINTLTTLIFLASRYNNAPDLNKLTFWRTLRSNLEREHQSIVKLSSFFHSNIHQTWWVTLKTTSVLFKYT